MTITATPVLVLAFALICSFAVCAALVLTQRWHGRLSLDHDTAGVQKIHRQPVPRVGGIAIAIGLLAGGLLASDPDQPLEGAEFSLLLCALPVFLAGLIEDLTKRVSVRMRMLASVASAVLAAWLMDAVLPQLDTPGLDLLMAFGPFALLFTCFAVSGVTNAINIIDGLNGLASGSVVIMLGGLGLLAWMLGDTLVLQLCLGGIGALLGFMLLNYPFGKIFLGDGGAYLAGFWLAECAVLLLVRNPTVSTWSPLLVCFYPVWETGFSMYRRHVVNKSSSGEPDLQHLHHRIFHQLRAHLQTNGQPRAWTVHGTASPVCWLLALGCQGIALTNYAETSWLMVGTVGFAVVYVLLYKLTQEGNVLVASTSKPPRSH